VSPVKYELGFYIPEDDILHSHRRGNLKSYMMPTLLPFTVTHYMIRPKRPSASAPVACSTEPIFC
jgi:hypothetical protein